MDIKLILKLAKVSEATYDNPDKAKIKFKALGYDIVKYFENDVVAFITYLHKENSDKAINAMHCKRMSHNVIHVDYAKLNKF